MLLRRFGLHFRGKSDQSESIIIISIIIIVIRISRSIEYNSKINTFTLGNHASSFVFLSFLLEGPKEWQEFGQETLWQGASQGLSTK